MNDKNQRSDIKIAEIIGKTGLSRAAFSREYHIPVRTLENWAHGGRACPEYVLSLLDRCVTQKPMPLEKAPLPLKNLREKCSLSRAEFSREYNIPIRTLEDWESGAHRCPPYVAGLLERCVRYDHLPLYFCLLHPLTKTSAGDEWYISHSQIIFYLEKENLTPDRGFTKKRKCELELGKVKKKIESSLYQKRVYEYRVVRIEEAYEILNNYSTPSRLA